jgi:phenylpropionate dioxygenase-like ring-hydroxylating dioxygenase large terminal subunit
VTHASRFQKPGDYRTFEIAGYSFLVILGKDKQLRAFHNVCRHRAYAVTKKECGRSTVLSCRYHGWSYDTKGKLIKAPEFDNVPGFDKDMNSLWEIAIEVHQSLLFVNLDAGQPKGLDLGDMENKLANWRVSEMSCISDWKFEAAFNWKLLGMYGSLLLLALLIISQVLSRTTMSRSHPGRKTFHNG